MNCPLTDQAYCKKKKRKKEKKVIEIEATCVWMHCMCSARIPEGGRDLWQQSARPEVLAASPPAQHDPAPTGPKTPSRERGSLTRELK